MEAAAEVELPSAYPPSGLLHPSPSIPPLPWISLCKRLLLA